MYLLAIDDIVLADLEIDRANAIVNTGSDRYAWSVERRPGATVQSFVGTNDEPAIYSVVIRCPNTDTRDVLLGALVGSKQSERRLLVELLDGSDTLVTTYAAVTRITLIGNAGLDVDFDAGGSEWTAEVPVLTSKTVETTLDHAMFVAVPGNSRVSPTIRINPLAPRTAPTAYVGWSKRRRYLITNNTDTPWYRYPLRVALGDTAAVVTAGDALASGDDVRIWVEGLEQSRTLVTWNMTASYLWFICQALLPGDTLTLEVVYGNPAAGAPPVLAYPDLPPFLPESSTNESHVYPTSQTALQAGLGLWHLSKGTEGAIADFSTPGAWQPMATLENPDSEDRTLQVRAAEYTASGTKYNATLDAWRGPNDSTVVDATNPFDGVGLYNPLGIESLVAGFLWDNDGNKSSLVILARDSASEGWDRIFTEPTTGVGQTIASATYAPVGPTKWIAAAVWPDNFVQINPTAVETDYARARFNGNVTVNIDTSGLAINLGTVTSEGFTPSLLGAKLNLHLSADEISGLSHGDRVRRWLDRSGNENHAIQDTFDVRPVYQVNQLNGLPGVFFNAAKSLRVDTLPATKRDETILVVASFDDNADSTLIGATDTPGRQFYRSGPTQVMRIARTNVAALDSSAATVSNAENPHILAATITATTTQHSVDGTLEAAEANSATFVGGGDTRIGVTIGSDGSEDWLLGSIHEVIIAAALTTDELRSLEGYAAHKWGLAANLPIDHPYKVNPPGSVGSVSEADIYEVAAEVRVGGGGEERVAPYNALLVGNARQQSGAGTPRAACLLSETLIMDGDKRTQEVWLADLTRKTEDLSAHAVRGVAGWEDLDGTSETPTSEWVPLTPGRPIMPNADFATDIGGWEVYESDVGLTATAAWDGTVGGDRPGSLKIDVTANTAAAGGTVQVIGPRRFRVAGREAVTITAWMQSSNGGSPNGLVPLLFIAWFDEDDNLLQMDVQPVWVPVSDQAVRRSFAARVPGRAAEYRIGGLVQVYGSPETGAVWFDDIRPNDNDLYVADVAGTSVEFVAEIRARVL